MVHPQVSQVFKTFCTSVESLAPQTFIFYESALVYETNHQNDFDHIVVVVAPMERRIQWLQKSRNLSLERIGQIMQSQLSDEEKKRDADFVILNNGTQEQLEVHLQQFLHDLGQKVCYV